MDQNMHWYTYCCQVFVNACKADLFFWKYKVTLYHTVFPFNTFTWTFPLFWYFSFCIGVGNHKVGGNFYNKIYPRFTESFGLFAIT